MQNWKQVKHINKQIWIDKCNVLPVDMAWAPWSSWSQCDYCMEEDIKYFGDALNNGRHDQQPDAESCRSFCKTNHRSAARYFLWHSNEKTCWCKTSYTARRVTANHTSGEVDCKYHGVVGKGQRSRYRVCEEVSCNREHEGVCRNMLLNGGMPCTPDWVREKEIQECEIPATNTTIAMNATTNATNTSMYLQTSHNMSLVG